MRLTNFGCAIGIIQHAALRVAVANQHAILIVLPVRHGSPRKQTSQKRSSHNRLLLCGQLDGVATVGVSANNRAALSAAVVQPTPNIGFWHLLTDEDQFGGQRLRLAVARDGVHKAPFERLRFGLATGGRRQRRFGKLQNIQRDMRARLTEQHGVVVAEPVRASGPARRLPAESARWG